MTDPTDIQAFIDRWQASGAAERANYQLFLSELCDIIEVPRPEPTQPEDRHNAYVFERAVPLPHGTTGHIDLYKRGCFVLEAKQGTEKAASPTLGEPPKKPRRTGHGVRGTAAWDTAMEKAKNQAQTYLRSLPAAEIVGGRPPFLIVVDVGNTIALYSEFTRTGGNYVPFPDPQGYRLKLPDFLKPEIRAQLRQVWTDPGELDPTRRSARVTRDIADQLATLARELEQAYPAETVANFLMRCLFTMFAEDVDLLPSRSFAQLLDDLQQDPASFKPMVEHLWQTMNVGGFSVILRTTLPHFNGGLFAEPEALPLNPTQIKLLSRAAAADWRDVEPAIFGTLLERALNPRERHKLGAHYTPRAYVERLVQPTVIEPLRAEWEAVQTAAALLAEADKPAKAVAEVEAFQKRLASVRILDPACGSGNFLYVTLEHLKRLEGEVLNTLRELGESQMMLELESVMVTPQQFLGLEVNPRAAAIAELVLWIGFLQWHFRSRGNVRPPEPIIKDFHNIECRDAVLAWDEITPRLDAQGQPVTRWDGHTTKAHPVTSEQVPDETAQVPVYDYHKPRPAEWPEAEFVVGNPPFIGNKRMREALGDGYVEALRNVHKDVPATSDYVMYWWNLAALSIRNKNCILFGLVTTNSISQTFNRKVLSRHLKAKKPISLVYAIPDHPWVDSSDGADVRISMTAAKPGNFSGILAKVIQEPINSSDESDIVLNTSKGKIHENLTIGADVTSAIPLKANEDMSFQGPILVGKGFRVTRAEIEAMNFNPDNLPSTIRKYVIGRDITQRLEERYVIDFFGLSEIEARTSYPQLMQKVINEVKPHRDTNKDKRFREYWWLWGRPRPNLREAVLGLDRFIVTIETSKHKPFTFMPADVCPDHKLYVVSSNDAFLLGILSSKIHNVWALEAGGRLGVGNDPTWTNTTCFLPFPFPDATEAQKATIRELAEQLDAHRKRQQAQHPKLTMTNMYNVLEKLRAEELLSAKEQETHEQGLVSILKQLHDELDAAVFAAYGWPADLSDEAILERLVALNAERAAEEAQGRIRWLRPEYQAPDSVEVATQGTLLDVATAPEPPAPKEKLVWPKPMAEQAQAVRQALARFDGPVTAKTVAASFKGAKSARITELLETLVALGQAQVDETGRYVG